MFRVTNYSELVKFKDTDFINSTNAVSEEFNRVEVERSFANRDIAAINPDATFGEIEQAIARIDMLNQKASLLRDRKMNLALILSSIATLTTAFSIAVSDRHTAEWEIVDIPEMINGNSKLIHLKRIDFNEGVVEVWFNDGTIQFMYRDKKYELAYYPDYSTCAELATVLSGAVDDESLKGQPFEKKRYKEITNAGGEGNGTDDKKAERKSGVGRKRSARNPEEASD